LNYIIQLHYETNINKSSLLGYQPFNSALEVKIKMKELTTYIIRLAGLYLIVYTFSQFPLNYFSYISQLENSMFVYFFPLLIPLFAGIVFITLPQTISNKLIKTKEVQLESIETNTLLYVGIIITGSILLFYSLSDMVFHISNYYVIKGKIDGEFPIFAYDYPTAIATVIELVFSLSLIFKTKVIIKFIRKVNWNKLLTSDCDVKPN